MNRKTRWIVLALCAALVCLLAAPALGAAELPAWCREEAALCLDRGILTKDDLADLEAPVTRSRLTAMLWTLAGSPEAEAPAGTDFADVPQDAPYRPALAWAEGAGVVSGHAGGTFRPEDPVTRQQLVTILWRYARGEGLATTPAGDLSAVTDQAEITDYAQEPLAWALGTGLLSGADGGRLCPGDPATLGQAAVILARLDSLAASTALDYGDPANWVWQETEKTWRPADVFFLGPTAYSGGESCNLSLSDQATRRDFAGLVTAEKGIYDNKARFFAPYYRQAALTVYNLPEAQRRQYLAVGYRDVADAFQYYLDHYDRGGPIILAGFSQGAELVLDLLEDFFDDPALQDRLVACYAIGWRVEPQRAAACPWLTPAAGETDGGVVVSFNSEAPGVTDSLPVPAGTRTLAINPLNWRTDSKPASRNHNRGACYADPYTGDVIQEAPAFTGAWLDGDRGTLKLADVSPLDYHGSPLFPAGVYHRYDTVFFYRDLEWNVQGRIYAWQIRHMAPGLWKSLWNSPTTGKSGG